MALSRGPGDEPDFETPGNWSVDATLKKEDYFNTYLDGKRSPNDAPFEPELGNLLTKLYARQRHEANELLDRTTGEMQLYDLRHNKAHILQSGGCAPETLKLYRDQFVKEYREQCQGFAEERERYVSDFQRAKAMRADIDKSQHEDLQKGIDPDEPKLTQ